MDEKKFYAVFGIYDGNTMIELEEFKVTKTNRSEWRAKGAAKAAVMSYTHNKTIGIIQRRYSLTAKQLEAMLATHFISPNANYFVVTVKYFGNSVPKGNFGNKGIPVDEFF